jgi:Kef-type K+ transport system membrane component KefB
METGTLTDEGRWLAGAGRVVAVWVVLGVAATVVLKTQITATIQPWFLFCLGLGGAGLLAPVYGAVVYVIVLRRLEKKTARGAVLAAAVLFVLSLGFAAAVMSLLSALSALR